MVESHVASQSLNGASPPPLVISSTSTSVFWWNSTHRGASFLGSFPFLLSPPSLHPFVGSFWENFPTFPQCFDFFVKISLFLHSEVLFYSLATSCIFTSQSISRCVFSLGPSAFVALVVPLPPPKTRSMSPAIAAKSLFPTCSDSHFRKH